MDENDHEIKSPIKRLGSTRKLLVFNNIRLQLNEQLRCLDLRMEAQVALVTELQDFFRRRGELELDYSKNLDKLAKSLQLRHKEQKQKREQWPLFSSYACWQQLVTQTRNLSREHVGLSEVYSTHLVSRLGQVMEDVQRIYKRCREIGYEIHEEILRVLHELHTTMKTYHSYQGELRQTEAKLRTAELQRTKYEQSLSQDKLERSKKYKLMEKEVMKRKKKYTDAKLKALKSRNEYILCLEASNTTIHKYFVDDLSDLIDCMDFGFHNCISRALLMHVSAEEGRQRSVQNGMDTLSSCINSLDSRLDKQKFLEYNHQAFMIPKKLEFQGHKQEEPLEPEIQKVLHQEMESRLVQLQQRVTNLRAESEEVWKTLEMAESTLLEMLSAKDYDCAGFFGDGATTTATTLVTAISAASVPVSIAGQPTPYLVTKQPETVSIKLRADRQETEEFYLAKFREYLIGSTRIARLDAKQEYIRHALTTDDNTNEAILGALGTPGNNGLSTLKSIAKIPRRKRIGRLQMSGQPKLFAGSLEEYLEATNQEIPLIVKSCIRVINLYGLHHQGIFRVSGSQVEINNFREWFERGEDPLADMTDASDINSVAGVLKLYLRELREPLFPIIYFEQFMEISQLESKREFKSRMRELIQSLPTPVMVVLRYIFAFLNHLAEYSDENMMDPYNLAICFGPTLVPVPDDKDQVQYQNQVNDLIKNVIMFNDEIFQNDGGYVYEKYISLDPDDHDVGDSPCEQTPCDVDSEVCPSEDDSECMEATAQFDFIARSDRELSLKKGDMVTLYSQVSNDWWRGAINGTEGLIPDKYISLKMKDDDRDKILTPPCTTDQQIPPQQHQHQHLIHSNSVLHSHYQAQQVQQVQLHHQLHHTHPPPHSHVRKEQQLSEALAQPPCSSSEESLRRASSSNDSALSGSSNTSPLVMDCAPINWQQISGGTIITSAPTDDETPTSAAACSSAGASSLFQTQNTSVATAVGQSPCATVQQPREMNGHKKTKSLHCIETQPESTSSSSNDEEFSVELRRTKEIDSSNVNFSRNREQWQRRANSQSHIRVLDINVKQQQRHSENNWHTPDLVMDLPLSKKISNYGQDDTTLEKSPDSPDMQTSAERFAKQNQCTLKKNTKVVVTVAHAQEPATAASSAKPQIKIKPAVLKKPSFSGGGAQVQQPQSTSAETVSSAAVTGSSVVSP